MSQFNVTSEHHSPILSGKQDTALQQIQYRLSTLLTQLNDDTQDLKIELKSRPRRRQSTREKRTFRFPGKTQAEAWKFTVVLRILSHISDGLLDNRVCTKRDIYYKDPTLFRSQVTVDRYVDDIAYTLGVQRADLNVTASNKGLVAGCTSIPLFENSEGKETTVPSLKESDLLDLGPTKWILVVEKEATFRSILDLGIHRASSLGPGIVITGKGYPDLLTRRYLRRLSVSHARLSSPIPIFALVDFDPDGIAIFKTYRSGSIALAHEADTSTVSRIQWLGIRSGHLGALDASSTISDERDKVGLMPLTARDRKKAVRELGVEIASRDDDEECSELQVELQRMLVMGYKAEIQILDEQPAGLKRWVEQRLASFV